MHQRTSAETSRAARPSFAAALIDRFSALKRKVWRRPGEDVQFLEDELVELVGPDTRPTEDAVWANAAQGNLPWRAARSPIPAAEDGTVLFTFHGATDARDILGLAHSLRSEMLRTHRKRALLDLCAVRQPLSANTGLLLSSVLTTLLSPDCRIAVLHLRGAQQEALSGLRSDGVVRIAAFDDPRRARHWLAHD